MTAVVALDAIETASHFYLQPIVACANGIRPRSYPPVAIENGLRCSDAICFEFTLRDLPFPEHAPQVPRNPLPVVVFKAPGTLDARLWTDALGPTTSDPGQIEMVSIAEYYTGRYVIVSDTLTALAVRHVQIAEGSESHYTPFLDLQENPLRIIIATLLDRSLGESTYFEQTPHMFEWDQPSGALDRPERRKMAYEDAMQLWKQKSDIDWYTACNDREYQDVVSQWMPATLSTHQGKPFLSRGDVLKMSAFAYRRRYVALQPLYAKEPLPESTAALLEERRRNELFEALGSGLDGANEFEIRILYEIDSSNLLDGASFVCEMVSLDEVPLASGPKIRVKVFDDRRMGDREWIVSGPNWFSRSVWTQSDVLVGLEDGAYRRLDHAQGTVLPYYYGAHEVVLPDGTRCWAILTELVQGENPQALPRNVPEEVKMDVVDGLRHVLQVLQFSDVTKPMWRYGDIRIHSAQEGSSDGAPNRRVYTIVNLWRATFSTLDGPPNRTDDYRELDVLLSLPFGDDFVLENFGEREPWDCFTWPMNEYIGDNWRPDDYDSRYYTIDLFPRRSL